MKFLTTIFLIFYDVFHYNNFVCEGWLIQSSGRHNNRNRIHRSAAVVSLSASLRKVIPYVETYEEQKVRELWERNPFDTSKSVVSQVLEKGFIETPLLKRLDDGCNSTSTTSGYEHFFDSLYKTPTLPEASEPNPYDKSRHFRISVCYRGDDFCGWQRQPDNHVKPSIQQTLEDWLRLLDTNQLDKELRIKCCGRTDAGVNAIGQVFRFRTRDKNLDPIKIQCHLDKIPHSGIKCTSVTEVSRGFHPVFTASCRAYAYLIDIDDDDDTTTPMLLDRRLQLLNDLLRELENHELSYVGLSYGRLKTRDANCILYHARASRVQLLINDDDDDDDDENNNENNGTTTTTTTKSTRTAVCIELVGNRFLRRMIRLLVEVSLRLIYYQPQNNNEVPPVSNDALLRHIQKMDRNLVSRSAPPDGLIFVGAGFNE